MALIPMLGKTLKKRDPRQITGRYKDCFPSNESEDEDGD
jgi:hypothetical protein